MRLHLTNLMTAAALMLAGSAHAQQYLGPVGGQPGTPVDPGVADSSANATSQRVTQPGLGQFGVGSLLLDRHVATPHQPDRFDPFAGDGRVSHRYLMQAPGVTALMNQTDYIGPSPRGGWAFNGLTYDGAQALIYSADTVFVLSPELLQQRRDDEYLAPNDHPSRVQPATPVDFDAYMRDARVKVRPLGQPYRTAPDAHLPPELARDPNYVHPEIIERRKRLKAEREAEARAKQEAEREQDAQRVGQVEEGDVPESDKDAKPE